MTSTVWDSVLGRIETKVNKHSYYTWFRQTTLESDDGGRLVVRVADPMAVDWLIKHYSGIIDEASCEVGRPGVSLEFRFGDE
jgi:chromosomal replication initiation ATPase DnaA